MMATTAKKVGASLNDCSAHEEAASKRPANRCDSAIPACMRNISGSSGLKRIARVRNSMAASGSPRTVLRKPPRNQAAAIQLAGEMGKRMSAPRERDGVVLAQFHREARQSNAFRDFLRPIGHPAIYLAPEMTPGRHCMGGSKLRIELHGLVEKRQRLVDRLPCSPMKVRHGAQIVIVGTEVAGRLPPGTLDLRPLELGGDCPDDAGRDLILKLEDIVEPPFESIGPKVGAG